MEHLESTIYCEKHPKVHQILCYPCLDRQYSQFHCISFGYNNGNNSELFILAPVTISKSTLDFTLNSGYNIVVSGCGEAWYRAWFGSKRPRVQIPTLRPCGVSLKDLKRSADDTPHFLYSKELWAVFVKQQPIPDAQELYLVPGEQVNVALGHALLPPDPGQIVD